ncbi:MAG: general secretion pathway protein GspK [Candidatus Competibacterales bacterium]
MIPEPSANPRRRRGFVLAIVLWVITLMALMAASFSYELRTETRLARFGVERAKAQALAEAGLYYAALELFGRRIQPPPEERLPVDGTPVRRALGGGEVTLRIRDSSGRVDLNRARRELMDALLRSVGVEDEERRQILLDTLEDWRDPDDLSRPAGGEVDEYREADLPPPKNGPFESVEELQQVMGFDAALYHQLAPQLTVHSSKPGINPAVASKGLIRALPDLDPEVVEDYLQRRDEHREQGLPAPPLPQLGALVAQGQGLAYHIETTARLPEGTEARLDVVLTRGRRAGQLYHILSWREGPSLARAPEDGGASPAVNPNAEENP